MPDSHFISGNLPPKPAVETGQPRPPRAPVDPGSGEGSHEKNQKFTPSPPAGQGPVLEWYKASKWGSIFAGVGGFIIVGVGVSLKTGSSDWASKWWMWLFPLLAGLLIGLTIRADKCSAGAEWFSIGKKWVSTYELTSVQVRAPANYRKVNLEDNAGRTVGVQLTTIQEDRDLWDLVYNGILHSTVHGNAEVNALARKAFNLPMPRERLE